MQQGIIKPEFSRLFQADRAKKTGQFIKLSANTEELEKLAERFGVNALVEILAKLEVRSWKKNGVRVTGNVQARMVQTCVVTLEEFETTVLKQVERLFEISGDHSGQPLTKELDIDMDEHIKDVIIDGNIDLGEIVSETIALEIDAHPRKPGAVFESRYNAEQQLEAEPVKENPFAVLKNIKKH